MPDRVTEAEVEKAIEVARGTEHFVGSTIPMERIIARLLAERDVLEERLAAARAEWAREALEEFSWENVHPNTHEGLAIFIDDVRAWLRAQAEGGGGA